MKTAVWWFRRDLRLADNPALMAALSQAGLVLPLFILDPRLLNSQYVGEKRLAFLYAGLRVLDHDLRQRGSAMVVRRGDPLQVLTGLLQETGAEAIFAEADYSPFARARDAAVARELPLSLVSSPLVHAPQEVLKPDGTPYTVFTPFIKAWLKQPGPGDPLPAPSRIPSPLEIAGEAVQNLPFLSPAIPFLPGEAEARRRLEAFTVQVIFRYHEDRNRVDLEGTSSLSPYLRFGMLSARQAVVAAKTAALTAQTAAKTAQFQASGVQAVHGPETWLNELIWREFYTSILYHFPYVRQAAFNPTWRSFPWVDNADDFAAWQAGRTGYPLVDAAMRQLVQTGWMHNRARMVTASFLTKDLLIDWRWGEKFYMQHLLDGDPAANNGGWQWVAGCGTDAAPYYRIFNPVLQSQKFDPQGQYIRCFLPELANVADEYIHEPWQMPTDVQYKSGCRIGQDYPAPIINHAWARQRLLAMYKHSFPKPT